MNSIMYISEVRCKSRLTLLVNMACDISLMSAQNVQIWKTGINLMPVAVLQGIMHILMPKGTGYAYLCACLTLASNSVGVRLP